MHSFPGAAVTKYHELSEFKQQKCIVSVPEARRLNQDVGRACSPETCRGILPCLLLALHGLPALRCSLAHTASLPPVPWSSHGTSPCVSVFT